MADARGTCRVPRRSRTSGLARGDARDSARVPRREVSPRGLRDGMFPLHQVDARRGERGGKAVAEAFRAGGRAVSRMTASPCTSPRGTIAPDAVTRALLESFPAGARRQDAEGELPLHAVCATRRASVATT